MIESYRDRITELEEENNSLYERITELEDKIINEEKD